MERVFNKSVRNRNETFDIEICEKGGNKWVRVDENEGSGNCGGLGFGKLIRKHMNNSAASTWVWFHMVNDVCLTYSANHIFNI